MYTPLLLAAILGLFARPVEAQTASTTEYALVVVIAYQCPCNAKGIDRAVAEMHRAALTAASAQNSAVRLIGVSIGSSPRAGAAYLMDGVTSEGDTLRFPEWDEIHAGRGWLNDVVLRRMVQEQDAMLAYPQLIVLKRDIRMTADRPVLQEHLVNRLLGTESIRAFRLPGG